MSAPPPPTADPAIAARPPTPVGLSIVDFMTDGSLAGLCDELTTLTGTPVLLRERSGRRVVRRPGLRPWAVLDTPDTCEAGEEVVPLVVEGETIGSLVL